MSQNVMQKVKKGSFSKLKIQIIKKNPYEHWTKKVEPPL